MKVCGLVNRNREEGEEGCSTDELSLEEKNIGVKLVAMNWMFRKEGKSEEL